MADTSAIEASLPGADDVALLQAVADPIRWAILDALSSTGLCVCELRERVPIPGNLLSYHLKVLREAGLIVAARRGRWIDYSLADDARERMLGALPGARVEAGAGTGAGTPS